jgi:hypothetical protein
MNKREKKARIWCPGGGIPTGSCWHDDVKDPSLRKKVFQRCIICGQRFELKNEDCCCPGSIHPRMPKHKAVLRPSVLVELEAKAKKHQEEHDARSKYHAAKKGKLTVLPTPRRILCSICKVVPRRPNKPFCNTPECTRQGTKQERLYRKRQNELTREAEKLGMY